MNQAAATNPEALHRIFFRVQRELGLGLDTKTAAPENCLHSELLTKNLAGVLWRERKRLVESLPRRAGIYCLKSAWKPVYIGKSVSIGERASQHFRDPRLSKIDAITWSFVDPMFHLAIESMLIYQHLPEHNSRLDLQHLPKTIERSLHI